MPGFNVAPLGGGYSGSGPSNTLEIRRKHRWVFQTLGRGAGAWSPAELLLLQSVSRPSFKMEEMEMHHNQEKVYLAGKQEWEPVTMKWYDSEQSPDISRGVYHWLETVVNLNSLSVAHPRFYKREAVLEMIDGTGQASERWAMYGTWPSSVKWNELSYSESELLTIEATMRYDRAVRACIGAAVPAPIVPSCPQGT